MATITNEERTAWLAERRTGLGGSDIAKIFGLSKWGSAVDVYLDKKGLKEDEPESEAMKLGTYLEPYVAERFMEESGLRVIDYKPTIHGTGNRSFALGNLDRIVVEDGQDINEVVARLQNGDLSCVSAILECKTATKMDDWHDEFGNFKVPEYYRAQVLWYLGLVPSAKRIYVAVFYTGLSKGFEFGCIERSDVEDTINKMFVVAGEWWKTHILGDVLPEAQSIQEVKQIFPKSVEYSSVSADKDIIDVLTSYRAAAELVAKGEATLQDCEDKLSKYIGANELLVNAEGTEILATFKSGKDTIKDVTDWEAVARKMNATEDVIKKHTEYGKVTRRGSRPLRVLTNPKPIKKDASKDAA